MMILFKKFLVQIYYIKNFYSFIRNMDHHLLYRLKSFLFKRNLYFKCLYIFVKFFDLKKIKLFFSFIKKISFPQSKIKF
jgi:hypothetical protein